MFSICVERLYLSKNEDKLNKIIRTFEFSEIFDTRPIYIAIDKENTYIERKYLMTIDVEMPPEPEPTPGPTTNPTTDVTTDTENNVVGDEPESGDTASAENYTHIQVMSFNFYFPKNLEPSSGACESFGNPSMMSYTLKVANGRMNEGNRSLFGILLDGGEDESAEPYELAPFSSELITGETANIMSLKFRWTTEMGVMADREWRNSTVCSLLGKTRSNFTYMLSNFYFKWTDASQPGYDPDTKQSTFSGDTEATNISISY